MAKKKIKLDSKVQIIEPVGYMQGQYENEIGIVIDLKETIHEALVQFPSGTKLSVLIANLKVL